MLSAGLVSGCQGIQSALDPAGEEASQTAALFWVMLVGGVVIWVVVVGLLLYSVRSTRRVHPSRASGLIFWGGVVFPSLALLCLLAYALWLMPTLRPWSEPSGSGLSIEVVGKQYWWHVRYHDRDGAPVISANEIRVPVGERVELILTSADVIHSFWIPSLGGKMDMVPGRTNRLSLQATKAGTYRGPCAEFCGTSHALMAFAVVVMDPAAFREWLAARRQPSAGAEARGRELFLRHGCGACHTIAGTEAQGLVGPDLSHLGSRETVAAGILPNTTEAITRFIAQPEELKPGSEMPGFGMLPRDEIEQMAAYLKGLR
ncbi:cytochrome c oxidase subunit II [Rhizobiaceae sp. 2RAB30]